MTETSSGLFQPCPAPERKRLSNPATAAMAMPSATRPCGVRVSLIVEVLRDLVRAQDALDVAAFVEALVGDELQLGGIFGADSVGDLALEEGGVLSKRLQYFLLVLAEQRLHEDRRMAKVGRHAHLGDADEVRLQGVVMDVAALEQFAQHVTHLLADAE